MPGTNLEAGRIPSVLVIGGSGRAPVGGGAIGALTCPCTDSPGKGAASATVDRLVPVVKIDPTELPRVRPEKLLESDCLGGSTL